MNPVPARRPKLPVAKVIAGGFLVPWVNRRAFGRALAIPTLLFAGVSVGWDYLPKELPGPADWGLQAVYALVCTIFAVTCHRLVLLNPEAMASRVVPQWSWRESRFFAWTIASWILIFSITHGLARFLASDSLPSESFWFRFLGGWLAVPCMLLAFYVFARLSVIFPATAVDASVDLKWAWRLTAENGWRLFVVVYAMPVVLGGGVSYLYRDGATVAENIILALAASVLFAVEIAALSFSYRELTKDEAAREPMAPSGS
jgi:hypothetical protein